MAQDHLQLGVSVKHPVGHHAQDMQTNPLREAERRTNQPLPVCPELVVDGSGWVARV